MYLLKSCLVWAIEKKVHGGGGLRNKQASRKDTLFYLKKTMNLLMPSSLKTTNSF